MVGRLDLVVALLSNTNEQRELKPAHMLQTCGRVHKRRILGPSKRERFGETGVGPPMCWPQLTGPGSAPNLELTAVEVGAVYSRWPNRYKATASESLNKEEGKILHDFWTEDWSNSEQLIASTARRRRIAVVATTSETR